MKLRKTIIFVFCTVLILVLGCIVSDAQVKEKIFTEKSGFYIKNNYLLGVYPEEKVGDIKAGIKDGRKIEIKNRYGSSTKDDDELRTSFKVEIEFRQYEAIVVIKGDINGDSKVNSTDYLKLRSYFSGASLKDEFFAAADIIEDDKLSSADYLQLKYYYAGKVELYPDKELIPEKTQKKYTGDYSEYDGFYGGVDDLGREQYYESEILTQNTGKKEIGMFYFLWLGAHGRNGPYNNSEIVQNHPDAIESIEKWQASGGGQMLEFHFWNEPLFGYYFSNDKWVMRKHVQMLTDAGIDFIIFDTTNAFTYDSNAFLLFSILDEYSKQGYKVPKFAYMTHAVSTATMDHIYKEIYLAHPEYSHLWYMRDGKPLILGENPSADVKKFFNVKYCIWPDEPYIRDAYPFIDEARWLTPQSVYGADGRNEVIDVSLAQRINGVFSASAWYGKRNQTRGYKHNFYKNTSDADALLWGTNFAIGFDYALRQDTESIFLTGWNEWVAQLMTSDDSPVMFVDNADTANSRDIEPMNGILKDNYYMQTINAVKEYKHAAPRVNVGNDTSINIDGQFSQWNNVSAKYTDYIGDTANRNATGFNNIQYIDRSGRNDFKLIKTAKDSENIYFYVQTNADITGEGSSAWMNLFIRSKGADTPRSSSWEGFDYVINRTSPNGGKMSVEKSKGGWNWESVGTVSYKMSGKELMIAVPKTLLGIAEDDLLDVQFKWADNCGTDGDVMKFYTQGDAAPLGRLTYVFSEVER